MDYRVRTIVDYTCIGMFVFYSGRTATCSMSFAIPIIKQVRSHLLVIRIFISFNGYVYFFGWYTVLYWARKNRISGSLIASTLTGVADRTVAGILWDMSEEPCSKERICH